MNTGAQSHRFEAIEHLRAFAALWVLTYHVNLLVISERYFAAPSMGLWAELGHHGVEVFFVLSGFVIALVAMQARDRGGHAAASFIVRRWFRIFPAYLAVAVPLTIVALITGLAAPATGTVAENIVRNLLLLPRDDLTTYIPVVAWTLTHELLFYGVAAIAFINRGVAIGVAAAWVAAIVWFIGDAPTGWQMPLSPLNLLFLVGFAAGALLLRLKRTATIGQEAGLPTRISLQLGRQSYSLYLVHYPIAVVAAMLLTRLDAPAWTLLPTTLVAAIAVSHLLYKHIETPGIAWGKRLAQIIMTRSVRAREGGPEAHSIA